MELLAPAGSMEALQAAVQNGCDAVYLGGAMYGARAFANNFGDEEIIAAIRYAHVYGVRVFVTMNTLIHEEEFDACVEYAQFLYTHDVDALIVQDLGLFSVLHERFPDMELHASTQMHIHNPQGIRFMESCGASRVVVPRETSLEEIREYAKLGVDLEVFVQGALCISYSGQCLMSSLTFQRSGNRGECAQNCRMKYQLEKQDGEHTTMLQGKGAYLLSPKDLNTITRIPELIEAGIASFKIEGRMKRAEYVALMVRVYRKAIDAYYAGIPFVYDEETQQAMKKVFNRGFSEGHLFHRYGPRLMNPIRPNHMGVAAGDVIGVKKDRIVVALQHALHQGDGIRILQKHKDIGFQVNYLYKDGLLVNHGDPGDIVELERRGNIQKGTRILVTSDRMQLEELQKSYQKQNRTVPIYGTCILKVNDHALLRVMDLDGNQVEAQSEALCERAQKTPLAQERVEQQLRKTKDTPFVLEELEIQLEEHVILPIREINEMRRSALRKLEEMRAIRNPQRRSLPLPSLTLTVASQLPSIAAVVHTKEQLDACRKEAIPMIFVENRELFAAVSGSAGIYERTPRVMKDRYADAFCMIQETGGLSMDEYVLCDISLNMTNSYTAAFLFAHHAAGVAFSPESSLQDCIAIKKAFRERYGCDAPFYYTVYGRDELMLSEYCPINAVECNGTERNCGMCRGNAQYALVDARKNRYPIMTDAHCRTHILHYDVRNHIVDIPSAKAHGIQHFLFVFTLEDEAACRKILRAGNRQLQI